MLHVGKRSAVAIVLGCVLWARPARADEVSALLDQGVALRREHRNEEAVAVFARAVQLSPSPRTHAQLALAEQAAGRWLDAERDLDVALAASDDPWIVKNLAALQGAREVVLQHLAWLIVEVDAGEATARLAQQEIPVGAEVRVLAGEAVLEVQAPGREPGTRHVVLSPGGHEHVNFALSPAATLPAASPPPAPPDGARSPSTTSFAVPWVLGGAGALALGVGSYFGVRTLSDKSSRDAQCTGGCSPAALAADSDARSSATASTVAFSVGGALLVTGAAWWLYAVKAAPAVRVAPAVGQVNGLTVQGPW